MKSLAKLKLVLLVLLTGALFMASPVFAGGLYISEFGHPLQGASNAGAGSIAQDASTAFTDPAGVMQLDESE